MSARLTPGQMDYIERGYRISCPKCGRLVHLSRFVDRPGEVFCDNARYRGCGWHGREEDLIPAWPIRDLIAEVRTCWAERSMGIAAQFICGDSITDLATMYGLTVDDVQRAIRDHNRSWRLT